MKIGASWLDAPPTRRVAETLGEQAYFVGGAVRNAILGGPVTDIDLATPLLPEEVVRRAEAAGLHVVPTGIAHGTVTLIADGHPYEVTTFRRDVATDGRRATVAYATEIEEDAARRDFTINALYAKGDGTLIDPLGGLADIAARRVRFVGDPAARIAEDYLRVLRFFRFFAWYGDAAAGPDPAAISACAAGVPGLAQLSRERVGAEMRKLLGAPDPVIALAAMAGSGVLAALLPGASTRFIAGLVGTERRSGEGAHWLRRLAALGGEGVAERLRLSGAETAALGAIAAARADPGPPAVRAHRHGLPAARDALLIAAAESGTLPEAGWQAELRRGAEARFPLSARDLMPPLAPGPALGTALERLREEWVASDFTLTREALVALLPRL